MYKLIRDYLLVFFKYGIIGNSIRIEASSLCQLRCPECPQIKGQMKIISKGYLKFNDFKKFVDNHPNFKNIELSNYGEMFLNPELEEIIKYGFIKNINLKANGGVNLNTISEKVIECLVKYKFKAMTISLDGASDDTYKIYRRGGSFDKVIENIEKINYYKQKYKTALPKLTWQFVVFGHNEHEFLIARNRAKELNMRFVPKLNWSQSYSPVKDIEFVRREVGFASRQEYEQKTNRVYELACDQLWFLPQINWDGRLLGCCVNLWGDFGNIFESGLRKCLKNKKYIYAKKVILGKERAGSDVPCFYCFKYRRMLSRKIFLKLLSCLLLRVKAKFLKIYKAGS